MVFTDADEFLVFRDGPPVQSLPNFLKAYEQYSGGLGGAGRVAVAWAGQGRACGRALETPVHCIAAAAHG